MTFDPWITHRDDLTLFEEGLDDVFLRHERSSGEMQEMEDRVLQEYLDTEERYEKTLFDTLGSQTVLQMIADRVEAEDDSEAPTIPTEILMVSGLQKQAFLWAKSVLAWVFHVYVREHTVKEEYFRLLVNAHLVPIKVAFASMEEGVGDKASRTIAKKEYELAHAYLARAIAALSALELSWKLPTSLISAVQDGEALAERIQKRITKL